MDMEKISRTAGKLSTAFGLFQKLTLIAMIMIFMAAVFVSISYYRLPEDAMGLSAAETLSIGPVELNLDPALLSEIHKAEIGSTVRFLWFYFAIAAVSVSFTWFGLGHLQRILDLVAQGQPFHPQIARLLRRIAWLYLADGVLDNLAALGEVPMITNTASFKAIMATGLFTDYTVNYSFKLNFLLFFFLLMLISWVFAYGAELQRQSDETL